MGRIKAFDLVTLAVVSIGSIYMGAQFFEPIVVDQLRKDGNLRKDVEVPQFDENQDGSKNAEDLRAKLMQIRERELQEAGQKGSKS
ncbi:hypothetical protein ZYGR_0H03610 [Zygosaccharomyces rouxii]|uniref:Protein ECM19 n=1 Tax=Zygosaccharomyces rouxii TaxID=4956 RepID=A0A1Q2ZVL9_ZYGRO|nr:hypothetical protein LQ764DRAFT_234518 [Zygosaccharomyces rouxii]GAV47517.1 hypothetical protein ZYGR_0H03610 [Zygosaccharomyces rouxii]